MPVSVDQFECEAGDPAISYRLPKAGPSIRDEGGAALALFVEQETQKLAIIVPTYIY